MGYELFKEWEREEKIAEADRKHGYGQNYYESESGVTPYDYTHPDEEQQEAPAMQTEVQPYLANVRNVINLKTQYDADPNFSDPFAPRQAVDDTYTYLSKTKYKDIPVENWTDLDASDVFYREYLSKMAQPVKQETIVEPVVPEFIPQNEAQKAILEGDKNRHVRDWSQLSGSDKFIYGITPSSNVATDAPEATKYTKGIVQAIPTTTVAAKAGSLFGPWGTVIGGGIGLGISAYQTFTGKQVPIAGNVLEALDKPGQWAEQGLGFITQAGKRTWDWATGRHDGSDTRMLLEVLGEMWHDRRQMWEGGKYFMETVASPLLDIPFDVIRKIGGQDWSGYGQVIDPVASDKPVDLIEGTYGIPGMENAGKLWSDLVEHGYSEQVASDMIASGMFSMGSTSWMWADLIGQESVDPLNALPYFTNKAAGKTANILKSSETPTTKAFGDALAAAAKVNKGGLFELGDLMKDQFRTMDVNTLGSWAKRMSGIDPVTGKLSELDVTDPHRKFNWYRKQAELTPESKAIDVSTKANDTLMTQTFEAQDSAQLRAVYDQLSRLDDITPGENSTIVDSAETRTIANGLRDGILNSNATIVMDQFDATVTNRNTLNAVAADLDLTPEKVYDMLRNDPDVFTRRVNEYATAHDGKIGGVEVAAIEPQLKIYTGDKPAPYSLNEVKLLVNASVIDKMSDYYIKAYGIKPDGMFNKMSNLMKDAQSILLLGASPSYAINNVVNNLVTQAAVGALGFMTPSMINDIRTRMGITPTRMGESLAEMRGTENLTGINKKIRDVKTSQNDIFDKVNKAVKQGNDTLGVFGKISRRAEQSMSDNAIAVGINQYWKKRWKKGTGFPEMPVELVALIEAQTPGMTDVIYGAIERGMNMTEVRNGIFGTYIKPGAAETVQSIIGRLFPDEAGLYDEVFVKAGLVDRLEREFTYSDTDAERAAAWNRVKADVESFIGTKRQIDLEMMSDNFKVIFEKEGLPFVSKYMAEAAATRGDIWKRSRDLWEDTYQKISLFNVKRGTDQYKRLIAATAYEVDKAFKVANEAYSQAYKAMLEGLGVSTDENVAIMKNVLDIQDTWGSFYKQETELMDQYYAMVDHDPNAWAKTQAILNGLAKDAFDKEIELQTKIDNSIAEAVKKAVDGDITQLEQNMSVIRAIRERMRDWQIKTRETVADMTESERNAYYKKHNPEYNGMIQEIRDLQVQNGKIIEDNRMNAVPNRKKATVTADDTVKMQHAAQAADVIKERAKVATQGYMDREAIRQAWVDTGISEQAVDLQMKLMDAAEKRWNADNPGKNFYTEGLRIREITREVGGEHGLLQWGTIAETDIDTPQFKQAFGKTKVVDDAGNPKAVYHGSPYAFEEFNYKHRGMNGSSEGYGFYFSDDINIAEGYSKNTGNIYKTYVNIEKPLSNKSYTISKAELKKLLIAIDKSDMADVESGHWFLSDYGDIQREGLQRVLNVATDLIYDSSTNDVDMISSIINTSSPDRVYRALKQTLGYDGIITKWDANDARGEVNIYIPFLPEQIKSVYNKGTWNTDDPNMLFQTYAAAVADGSPWYSHMETVITDKFPEKMNAQSVRNWLIKQGVTKQELQWSGMDEYLDSATGQVTKADLQRVVDMDRMKTTLIDTGNGNMLEVQAYKVTSGMAEPQKLFQAFQDGVKGKFEVIDGDVAIRALKAADVTTMVHETGHAFRRTLNDDQMEQFTRWAGFDSVEQFRQLEYQFQNDYKNMTEADRKRYVDSEEKFARGWEQYLIDGSAPTIGLKSVFRKFTQYMLEVYRSVKDLLTKDYSRQGEFVFDGQVLNINAEINGVKLRDIFDSMLSEKAERTPTYAELISKRIDDLRADKANARLDDQTIYRKAVYGVNSDILSPHGSLDQAMQSAIGGNQPFALPDGTIIDDIALYDAIASAQSLRAYNPFGEVRAKETRGNFTTASGINDARTRYEFQYKVIDLNDVTPSHTWLGNQLLNNQEYNAALQPRSRNEFQSVMQIDKIAANLSPDMLLLDSHAIDRGSPIVGADNNVESGNGRVLALLRAKDLYPDAWANYQAELKNNVQNYGIDPESINAYENPILVRERITDMDAVDFAREANKPVALQMTAKENAIDDAKLISDVVLSNMDVLPTETITGALDAKRNAGFVTEFMKKIPDNEAAQYSYQKSPYEFVLNEAGRTRIINAIFAKVYGESADQLLKSFTMSTDSNIKAVESALKDSLPQMAKVEGLINRGSRSAEYSIANDVAIAAQKLSELRKAGVKVEDYVNQIGLPGLEMELTQVQNKLLSFFSEQRNAKKIREFLRDYAAQVENQADVDQSALFAMEPITKEFMIDRALAGEAVAENADVPSLFQMASDAYKQNSQTRFDDGSIVPDTDADNIILTGAINAELQAEYDAFLNKFENIEDRTFAQTYYDWYLSGQEGDAPKAANPFTETKVTKQAEIYADELRRYKQLYDKGVEVDPLSVQPLNGTYLKRTYAFNHGDYVIAANVYHDGKLVAYLPTNSLIADVADNKFMAGSSPEMQKVITVGDESFRVIGLDPDNPKRLVYLDDGIVRSVEPGIIDGVEPSEFAEHVVRPGKQGSVPVNMPEGYALNELKDQFITPVMNEFLNEYQKRIDSQREVNTQGMPAETRALLNQYLDQVQSKMQAEKYRAQKYGYMKKDQAMLNYDRRYGFDSWLTMMMPYQFWYTRSMYNWANRMIDTPGIYSMYARIKELEEKNKRETRYATRFDGRISVYAPYLPSYYGDRIFIDPLGPMFPFSQFGRNIDMIADNENQITQAAKSIIEEQAKIGFITPEEREQALTKQGGIWENAFAQAKMESGKDIGLTGLAGSYFTGPVFIDWLRKIKQGKEDQLTALPITRTGNAIRGILDDTALAGLGKIAQDALSFPEKVMRKAYGAEYHEFGSWGNGAIQKQLASMVGNGEINAETGEKAALEKDGNPHWDEAVRRAREENLYKVPSAGAVNAMVNFLQGKGSIQEIFASLALVPFGGLMYPEGERKTRDKYPSLQQAHLDKESGKNPNAVNEWYDANPDWTFRNLMFNDDPNDLLRQKMIGDLNDMYYGLPYSQQQRMKKELGPDFAAAFLNKETRNYEAIPTDQLVEWVVKSGGKIPNVPDLKVPQVQPINLYPESFANPVDEFYRIESEQYSQHKNLEKVYYALPSEQRKDFLNTFPQLSEYWAWKRSYKDQHPEVQMWQDDRSAYFNEETAINAYAEMSERTRDALRYSSLTDTKLSSVAMMELKSLYAKHANPSFIKDVDAFIKILQQYGM